MDARYLGSAVAVTPFVLGKHTSVEERYPGTTSSFDNLMVVVPK